MTQPVVVVVSGGDPPGPLPADLESVGELLVVAADSGVDHALALGLVPRVAVGDFDSVSAAGLERVTAAGAEVHRHRPDKDATDLELALEVAAEAAGRVGAGRVVVVGGSGGRLDHVLASVAVLARPRGVAVTAHLGGHRVEVVHPGRVVALSGEAGSVLTLLAHGGPATGVTTTGLRYALRDAVLEPWSSLGVSNEFTGVEPATVRIGTGVVLAITPSDVSDDERQLEEA